MEIATVINRMHEFFEKYYHAEIVENSRQSRKFINASFKTLSMFDPEIADSLLDQPEEIIKAAELAVDEFELEQKGFRVRFYDLPETQKLLIRNIRSEHINLIYIIEGIIRQKSDVRPQVTSARFECPSCGNVITILQLESSFREPNSCSCGRKGKFRLLSKELVDAQGIVLEESAESIDSSEQPKRINVLLKDDLVSPISEKKTSPGSKIKVVGVIKEVPIILKTGSKSTRFDILLEANYVETTEESFADLIITEEEEKQIKELGSDPNVVNLLVESLAPSIYGYEKIKESLLLQLVSGVRKVRKDKVVSRGDIHILLVGDPGAGKSALLKRIGTIAPRGRYVSGKGVSAAGLTASVVRDEFLKGWSLEAGAMVLASNGICVIDELDKMSKEDTSAMHEAMENQTVSISKANIQATLIARTTVLAAANPKYGRFDPYGIIADQIDLPPTLINRFDLIFPIKDIPEEIRDEKMATHILGLHKNPDIQDPPVSTSLLRKYIAYSRRHINPELTDIAIEEIKSFYVKMRMSGQGEEIRSVPISARQLEALVRLSEACARLRLSDKVTRKDSQRAIELLEYCLMQVGFDKETGKIDIDRIATGVTASQRSHFVTIKEIIRELEKKYNKKDVALDEVMDLASQKGIDKEKVETTIQKLKLTGDLFEPKLGRVQFV